METRQISCPNCAAPLKVPIGEVETLCEYCGSQLRFTPDDKELEVVRTREEMKYRERVAVQKAQLRQKMEQEEMAAWRQTAGKVALAALPAVGDAAGRALFRGAMQRSGGCIGCGCLGLLGAIAAVGAVLLGFVR